ncbi:LysR family transcriptional regulator [Antarctobacter sp.]|uniref:LysR family transcriptional regulator n=1 Tax=Antarctobacter sp. TaxID=1872577 RepID=UPI003A917917
MDSRQLRYFTAVYETGSLSQASERLNIAVSALSHHIANLEANLSTALFTRRARGMTPTAAGERLYDHARAILRAMQAAEADIRNESRAVVGDVSVGMAYSAVKAIGVPLMKSVMADYPGLRLSITESLSGATLLHLMESEVDIAVLFNPPNDPRLRLQPILEERMLCVGQPGIIGATDDPIAFEDMLDLPLIILRQGLSARALLDDTTMLKQVENRAQLQLNSVQGILGALAEGLGCAIGTHLFARELIDSGQLHSRPIISPALNRTLFLCELADRNATYALEAVRHLILRLVLATVNEGNWDARITLSDKGHDRR